jgi:hypothetical protein
MPAPTETPTEPENMKHNANIPRANGMTAEEFAERLALIRRRKNDPEYLAYLERGRKATAEFRRKVEEEYQRQLDEDEGK